MTASSESTVNSARGRFQKNEGCSVILRADGEPEPVTPRSVISNRSSRSTHTAEHHARNAHTGMHGHHAHSAHHAQHAHAQSVDGRMPAPNTTARLPSSSPRS